MVSLKKSYKILSILLIACILAALVPFCSAFAAIDETKVDDGTKANAISNISQDSIYTPEADGVFGKAVADKVHKLERGSATISNGSDFIYVSGATTAPVNLEFSVALPGENSRVFVYTKIKNQDGSTTNGAFLSIEDDSVSTATGNLTDTAEKLCDLTPGQWVNIAVKIPGYTAGGQVFDTVVVYINGNEYPIKLATEIYGIADLRIYAAAKNETYYFDNIYTYYGNTEDYTLRDAKPEVDFASLEAVGNTIAIDEGLEVSEFKETVVTSANIRIYEDNTYANILSDGDEIPFGATVVFAETNGSVRERSYSYYTAVKAEYEEPELNDGTTPIISGVSQDSIYTPEADGVFGKAVTDKVHKLERGSATISNGSDYIYASGATTAPVNLEFSVALPAEAGRVFVYAKIKNEDGSTTNGAFLQIQGNSAVLPYSNLIPETERGKKLCDLKCGRWVNIAVEIPGYIAGGQAFDTVNVYVNAEKYQVKMASAIYGIADLRIYAGTKNEAYYFDNIRTYYGEGKYLPAKDKKPTVDLTNVACFDEDMFISDNTTVEAFKQMVKTKVTVRVFENDKYENLMNDNDIMSAGNIIVFATDNHRTTERAYSYYKVAGHPFQVEMFNISDVNGKTIEGSKSDVANAGIDYYLNASILNKSLSEASLQAIIASYDSAGKMRDCILKRVDVLPGENIFAPGKKEVRFEGLNIKAGDILKGYLWTENSNEPLVNAFEIAFDGKEIYRILAVGNSWGNDSFAWLPMIAKADGVKVYAVNMYKGGQTIAKHYAAMMDSTIKEYERIEYTPTGNITTKGVGFFEVLNTPGYSWDYVTMHAANATLYDYDFYWTEENPYITEIADCIRLAHPEAEVMIHETWPHETEKAKSGSTEASIGGIALDKYIASQGWTDEQIRPGLFNIIKNVCFKASEQIGNPGRVVPSGEAVNYAVINLGFAESDAEDIANGNGYWSRAMYRDYTPHLTEYGRILASLTWYEYLTGNDARENKFSYPPNENLTISDEDMMLLKEAAHWACSQAEYVKK